ncbi:MAG: FG-GAP repeat domain-containing protein, partial [Bacteriovoracaceae bacterium]
MNVLFLILTLLSISCSHKQFSSVDSTIEKKPLTLQKLNSEKLYGFKDVTEELGLGQLEASHIYVVDLNGDHREDLVFLPQFFSTPNFYLFDAKKNKFIKSNRNHLPRGLKASYLNFADFNNDGVVDVLVGPHGQKTELTKDPLKAFLGGLIDGVVEFKQIPNAFKLPKATITSSVFLDYDLDGKLDVFNAHWFGIENNKNIPNPDQLFKWDGKKFLEVSYLLKNEYEYNSETSSYINARPSFGVSVCDVDLNGFPDILVSSSGGASNKMWLNLYDGKHDDRVFEDYGKESSFAHDEIGKFENLGGGNSVFSVCHDYNNDGIMDLALGEITFKVDNATRDRSSILTGK